MERVEGNNKNNIQNECARKKAETKNLRKMGDDIDVWYIRRVHNKFLLSFMS